MAGNVQAEGLAGEEPFYIVINPRSGQDKSSEVTDTITAVLTAAGRRFELMPVSDASLLAETAANAVAKAQDNGGVVVAVGGDGTLNAVSQQVLGSGVLFGILPQGTFNYFGRTFGIPQETEIATRCLLDAIVEPVQVGTLNGRIFLVNASLGLYPQLLEEREVFKQRYGRSRLVAFWAAMVTFLHAHRQLSVELEHEGETLMLRTQSLVVGNNALQLEQIGIAQATEIARGHLVAMTSRPLSVMALYGLLLRGLMSRLGDAENIISFGFHRMTVRVGSRRGRIKVAMDGEISWLRSPLEFKVSEHRLPLLVPRDGTLRERK